MSDVGNYESAASKPCYICGEQKPSHVAVWHNDVIVGRVCADHTLYEVIFSKKTFLTVSVELRDEE